jgi:hypothetical protein
LIEGGAGSGPLAAAAPELGGRLRQHPDRNSTARGALTILFAIPRAFPNFASSLSLDTPMASAMRGRLFRRG